MKTFNCRLRWQLVCPKGSKGVVSIHPASPGLCLHKMQENCPACKFFGVRVKHIVLAKRQQICLLFMPSCEFSQLAGHHIIKFNLTARTSTELELLPNDGDDVDVAGVGGKAQGRALQILLTAVVRMLQHLIELPAYFSSRIPLDPLSNQFASAFPGNMKPWCSINGFDFWG